MCLNDAKQGQNELEYPSYKILSASGNGIK